MNDQLKIRWNKMQRIGKSNYLVRYGIVPWSLGLTLLFGIIEVLTQGKVIPIWLPIRLIVFALVGFFIANNRWQTTERKFAATPTNKR